MRRLSTVFLSVLVVTIGCNRNEPSVVVPRLTNPSTAQTTKSDPLGAADFSRATLLGKNVYFENLPDGRRRVLLNAYISLREGEFGLECLLCRRGTKEHESIFAVDADARAIHAGLIAAGAEPGHPVQFEPKLATPTGTKIKISVQYEENGKTKVIPAQQWVKNINTGKELTEDWVFAGSILYKDPDEPEREPLYLASTDGAYITVTSVPTAMLDLPIHSPKALDSRNYVPFTERIPELFSKVVVILEPVAENQK